MDYLLDAALRSKGNTPSNVTVGSYLAGMEPGQVGNAYNSFNALAQQMGKSMADIYNTPIDYAGLANANKVMGAYRSGDSSGLGDLSQYYVPPTQQQTQATTTTTPTTPSYLTMEDLSKWWDTAKKDMFSQQQQQQTQQLGNLYPRANWGNYQGTGRGARYFDNTTGSYKTYKEATDGRGGYIDQRGNRFDF